LLPSSWFGNNMTRTVWIAERTTNPHVWSSSNTTILAIFSDELRAKEFYAQFPQYHYVMGLAEPRTIIQITPVELDKVLVDFG